MKLRSSSDVSSDIKVIYICNMLHSLLFGDIKSVL